MNIDLSVLSQPEGVRFERKAAFLWNKKNDVRDRNIQIGVLKTVAGFLNHDGGTIVIGLDDNGVPEGIDEETQHLFETPSNDRYQLLIEDALRSALMPLPFGHVSVDFCAIEGKTICVLAVHARPGVTYVQERLPSGRIGYGVYVRQGNRTIQLVDIERDGFVVERLGGVWTFAGLPFRVNDK